MTRIDFHFNAPDKLGYGCRVVRKAYRARHPVLVWCDDEARLDAFDRLLWSDPPTEFVPHVRAGDPLAVQTPILLAHDVVDTDAHDVLVNLGCRTPPMFARFERLIEIVGTEEDDRAAARERWRFYRDRGYPMTRHDVAGAREP
ncbi:MAG: DNA polymerase III subunit chi [Burkholderiaceae bacterium]|nr:DNA polymerase III subunit chi [Burkholderiaceae bacterium]